jgi:hypothetical protein
MKSLFNVSKRLYHSHSHQHMNCKHHHETSKTTTSNTDQGSFWKVKIKVETPSVFRRLIVDDHDFRLVFVSHPTKASQITNKVFSTTTSTKLSQLDQGDIDQDNIGKSKSLKTILNDTEQAVADSAKNSSKKIDNASEFSTQNQFIVICRSTYSGCDHRPIFVNGAKRYFRIKQNINVGTAIKIKGNFPELDLEMYDNRKVNTLRKELRYRWANFDWIKALDDALLQQGKNYSRPVSATAKFKGDRDTYEDNENLKTVIIEFFVKLNLAKSVSLAFKGYETKQLVQILGVFTTLKPPAQFPTWEPIVDAILQELVHNRFDDLDTVNSSLTKTEFDHCLKSAIPWSAEEKLVSELEKVSSKLSNSNMHDSKENGT